MIVGLMITAQAQVIDVSAPDIPWARLVRIDHATVNPKVYMEDGLSVTATTKNHIVYRAGRDPDPFNGATTAIDTCCGSGASRRR